MVQRSYLSNGTRPRIKVKNLYALAGIDVTGAITSTGSITSTGNEINIEGNTPTLNFTDNHGSPNNPDYRIRNNAGVFTIQDRTNSNADRLAVLSNGTVNVYGNLSVDADLDVSGTITASSDTDQILNLNSSDDGALYIALKRSNSRKAYIGYGGSGSTLNIANEISDGDLTIVGNDGGSNINMLSFNTSENGKATFIGDVTIGGDFTINSTIPRITLNDTDSESDFEIKNENGSFRIRDIDNPTDRYKINTSGTIHEFIGSAGFSSTLNVVSNITVGGTVDGRDLATDGTKLDTIETNATADQSSSEIVALIADQTIAPSTIDMEDNEKIRLGNADDLLIYHDSSDSYIQDGGTGKLVLATNGARIDLYDTANSATLARFITGESVELYEAGIKKFETSSSGISVTGDITVSGTVDGRDVATDGTKLDGIEANATADLNGGEIASLLSNQNINTTGILTTQSSVTDKYVRMYGSSGSGRWDIYGNGTNLRISDNDSAGKVVVDTNLDVNGGDLTLSGAAPTISLTDTNNDPDYQLKNNNGAFQLDQGTSDTKFGITTDGHVEFPNDSQEIRIGEDADLVLSHTGTNSIIKFQGDGSLFFQYGTTNIASIGSQGFNAITGLSTEGSDIYTGNGAFIASDAGGAFSDRSGGNIDHMWHNETNSTAHRGWNFCEDTTYKAVGNAQMNAGRLKLGNQPAVLVTKVTDETYTHSDNDDPIRFSSTDTNRGGCTIASNRSRITVPVTGVYLLMTAISGTINTHNHDDGIQVAFKKNGNNAHPRTDAMPFETFGSENSQEFSFTANIVTNLSEGDYIEVALRNISTSASNATINRGYLGVVMLH